MSQTFGYVARWVGDLNEFAPAPLPSNDSQISSRDPQSGGESPEDSLVGLPIYGWGLHRCQQNAIRAPGSAHMLTSGPRFDAHRETERLWWRHLVATGVRQQHRQLAGPGEQGTVRVPEGS